MADYRTIGNHRRYNHKSVLRVLGLRPSENTSVFIYARVSSHKQKDDLRCQIDHLKEYAKRKDWKIEGIYSDIASGLNHKRKSLLRLVSDLPKLQPDFL